MGTIRDTLKSLFEDRSASSELERLFHEVNDVNLTDIPEDSPAVDSSSEEATIKYEGLFKNVYIFKINEIFMDHLIKLDLLNGVEIGQTANHLVTIFEFSTDLIALIPKQDRNLIVKSSYACFYCPPAFSHGVFFKFDLTEHKNTRRYGDNILLSLVLATPLVTNVGKDLGNLFVTNRYKFEPKPYTPVATDQEVAEYHLLKDDLIPGVQSAIVELNRRIVKKIVISDPIAPL